jgi:2-polyprenyl-6-methoxyphenol hydroxylase-like FAD-dependent oxidoreductase
MLATATLSRAAFGDVIDVGYPTTSESGDLSPTRPAAVPQDHLETVLINHLRGLPAACVALGVTAEDLWEAAGGLQLRLRFGDSEVSRVVKARYVLGADGGRGLIRQRLGVEVTSTEDVLRSLSTVVRAPLWDVVGHHRYGIYVTDTPAAGTFLPAGQCDRWVYGFSWDPRMESVAQVTEDQLIWRIRAAAGVPDLPVRVLDHRRFTFSAAIAERFRSGNAFLLGDAAHRVTPRGGTGMNTAIADGFNLAWKLSWVLHGWAPDSLLDTYETERRPIAEHNLARSLDPMGSRRSVLDEIRFDLGGRLPHLWIDSASGRISSLDLLGPGLTRLAAGQLSSRSDDQPDRPPVTEHRLDHKTASALGADQPDGVLLRPDGVVWDPPLSAALEAA